ncbi:MAG: amino acid ABC transporter ATP-binding protein [Alphaproteobacteria bacterium]|nr:amino acid ABC transporter ATP-binding protein [Alphaproteobacteria bacterium]
MLRVEGLQKHYGALHVLRGIELVVRRGEVVVLIGPSGSGKSSFLRCLNRLEEPSAGHIYIDGVDICAAGTNLPRVRRNIGMVFQHFNLFPHMTALGNVAEGPRTVLRMSRADAERRARDLLGKVGLSEKMDAHPAQLSGGQQQRVAIARALAMQPEIMLFDEVTSALDPELVAGVLGVMRQLAEEGMTMVVVTHEMDFARQVGDRVLMFEHGAIIEEGRPSELLRNPQHASTQRFLGSLLKEQNA